MRKIANYTFDKRCTDIKNETYMAYKHLRRCSISFNHSENTKLNHNELHIRMTIIKRIDNAKCWKGCGKTETLMPCS